MIHCKKINEECNVLAKNTSWKITFKESLALIGYNQICWDKPVSSRWLMTYLFNFSDFIDNIAQMILLLGNHTETLSGHYLQIKLFKSGL